jgi:hypothetical protein
MYLIKLHIQLRSNFSPMSDKEFNITIFGASNPSYKLRSNTEVTVGSKGNLYMLGNTNQCVGEIITSYLAVARRIRKMSFLPNHCQVKKLLQ